MLNILVTVSTYAGWCFMQGVGLCYCNILSCTVFYCYRPILNYDVTINMKTSACSVYTICTLVLKEN